MQKSRPDIIKKVTKKWFGEIDRSFGGINIKVGGIQSKFGGINLKFGGNPAQLGGIRPASLEGQDHAEVQA